MKLGLLYSTSKEHPNLVADFLNGIKCGLKHFQLGNQVELVSEPVGFGGVEKEVYEKTEKLLIIENVDMIIAYIDTRVLSLIEPLIYSTGKLFIVVNGGANYPEDRIPQKNIVFLSFRHSFLSWLTGIKAGESGSEQAAVATCFYDAGYLQISGMTRGYAKCGGAVRFNYVNRNKYDESFEIAPLTEFLTNSNHIDTILAIFDSRPASLFYKRLKDFERAGKLSVFASPMMLEPSALGSGNLPFPVEGFIAYDLNDKSENNQSFRNIYEAFAKKQASMFALQGWETILVVNKIISAGLENITDGSSIQEFLLGIEIETPRGKLKLDDASNYFTSTVVHVKMNAGETQPFYELKDADSEWAEFLLNPVTGVVSGWTNTYLCY